MKEYGEIRSIVDKLDSNHMITVDELRQILTLNDKKGLEYLRYKARLRADEVYGKDIYIRGLIEFTNYCKNDCLYCGIRKGNSNIDRYRLSDELILECCQVGYNLGFRTFVLQGGEDPFYTDEKLCELISNIRKKYPDCAITLSVGEKSRASYEAYFLAGANRYLLRHETADEKHYARLHPREMSYANRIRCLYDLKEIGYQTGCGFMVGSPYQSIESLHKDLLLINELEPEMVGIGPFIPQSDTPFGQMPQGTLDMTLRLLSIIRLMKPRVLLPATTALGTIHPKGREMGILAGANVVMPNLSPVDVRKKYSLYDNKICMGDEAAECRGCLEDRIKSIGYRIVSARGDYINKK